MRHYGPEGSRCVRVRRRLHSQHLLTRHVTTTVDYYLVTTRVHKAENVRSPVRKKTGMDSDHEKIAATPRLTMPEADWCQTQSQARVAARQTKRDKAGVVTVDVAAEELGITR